MKDVASNRTKLMASIEKMPSLPTTVTKVMELANDINSSARDLLKVIQVDPVLTAKVLKLINSAFFGITREVSLNQAVVLLGINTIKNLALSSAVIGNFSKNTVKIAGFDLHSFWSHSLGTAIAARKICRDLLRDKQNAEEYFVAGLVHDIGKIVMAQAVPDQFEHKITLSREKDIHHTVAEVEVIGIDHAETGSLLGEKWKLNESLVESIKNHHNPGESESKMVWTIFAANIALVELGFPGSDEQASDKVTEETCKKIGTDRDSFYSLLSDIATDIESASAFLQS